MGVAVGMGVGIAVGVGVGSTQAMAKASESVAMTPRFSRQSLARTFPISSWCGFISILPTLTSNLEAPICTALTLCVEPTQDGTIIYPPQDARQPFIFPARDTISAISNPSDSFSSSSQAAASFLSPSHREYYSHCLSLTLVVFGDNMLKATPTVKGKSIGSIPGHQTYLPF